MPWTNIRPIIPPPAGIRQQWTRAIIRNTLYMFQQGTPFIMEVDTSIPGDVNIIDQVPTFLNMAGIEGIFEARSRMGAWDTTNSIFWSDTTDVLDFVPDLKTRANSVKVDALKGNIIMILPATEGFIIYTTANIVGARYAPNTQKVFEFFEISDNLGIFSDYSVMVGEGETAHYAYTNGGLYRIQNQRGGAEPIATEVSDYITSFQQSPRISFHLNRYIALWLFGEGVDDARTVRQRNFIDAVTYWRQNRFPYEEYLNQYLNMQGLLAIDGGIGFTDEFPLLCYPEIPGLCDDNVLWYAFIDEWNLIELEVKTAQVEAWISDGGTGLQWISSASDRGLGTPEDLLVLSDETYDTYLPDGRPIYQDAVTLLRYSFDPNALMMYQAYVFQAKDLENSNHIQSLNAYFSTAHTTTRNPRVRHDVISQDPAIQVISDVTEPAEILADRRTLEYASAETKDPNTGNITFTNVRKITTEAFATQTRRVEIESFSILVNGAFVETRFPADGGSHDGDILSTSQVVIDSAATRSAQGLSYIDASNFLGLFDSDVNLARFFIQQDPSGLFAKGQPVNTLADDTHEASGALPPNLTQYRTWSTGSDLAAHTDRCTFANMRNFTQNRAYGSQHFVADLTETLFFEGVDDDTNEDVYSRRLEQINTITYPNFDVFGDDILTLDPIILIDEIPIKSEIIPTAFATVTRADGAKPATYLEQYYQDSLIEGISLLQVFQNAGWTIGAPPASVPNTPPTFLISGGSPGNVYNLDPTGSFEEYFGTGLLCQRLIDFNVTNDNISGSDNKFVPFEQEVLPDITLPETVFLTQTGAPGQLYPLYNRALIFDRLLEKWGTCDVDFRLFLDYSPINEITYDPILEEFVTRFTYDNFLSRLGSLSPTGMLVLFDDQPDDAYLVYGKIGWRRSKLTMMSEIFMEFAENCNANFILESSLDRRTLDPYNMRSIPLVRAGETWHGTVSARWFNLVIRGRRFHLTGLEFQGITLGRE